MTCKTCEAIALGLGLWIAGALLIVLFGGRLLIPILVFPVALLTAPAMWWGTRLYLRDVPGQECAYAGLRLGVIVVAVQCVLDSAGLSVIFQFGEAFLSPAASETLVVGLIAAYFWMLVVPGWEGKRMGQRKAT